MTKEFLEGLAALAQEKELLFLLDEVQCGFGRTGDLNGYDTIAPGLVPDGISWAKGMGGGFPIGSFYVAEKHAHLLALAVMARPMEATLSPAPPPKRSSKLSSRRI